MSDYKKMRPCMFLLSPPVQSPRRGAHVTAPVHPISHAASLAAGALRATSYAASDCILPRPYLHVVLNCTQGDLHRNPGILGMPD